MHWFQLIEAIVPRQLRGKMYPQTLLRICCQRHASKLCVRGPKKVIMQISHMHLENRLKDLIRIFERVYFQIFDVNDLESF